MAHDHRGRPLHAGKRTSQEYEMSAQLPLFRPLPGLDDGGDYANKPAFGGWEDKEGPAMAMVPRKPSPKGPQNMGAAKAY